MLTRWLWAFALTQAVEMPVYGFGLCLAWRRRLVVGFLASALTHPYVWFVLPPALMHRLGYWGYVVTAELLVVLCEGAWFQFHGVGLRRAFLVAALGNGLCVGAGFLLM